MPPSTFASKSKNMKQTKLWIMSALVGFTFAANAQNTVNVADADISAGDKVTWTKDNVYILTEPVFVENGAELTIEAGTVIKGKAGVDAFLTISRGAKIFANGTQAEPVIFTAEADDVNDPTDLGPADIGLWGGIVICGKAPIEKDGLAEAQAEGVSGTEPRSLYGGTDDGDNSGVLTYVSVRHAGFELGSGDELNGISFCGVGSGTTVEHVEIYANKDDGMEFFGGSVNVKWAIASFCRDDAFDHDEGWRGKGQFWFVVQSSGLGDCAGEFDGAIPDGGTRYSNPTIYNWTAIGPGSDTAVTKAAQTIMVLQRDGTAGIIANSIFTQGRGWALQVEDLEAAKGVDAFSRLEGGELVWESNLMYDFFRGNTLDTDENGLISVTGSSDQKAVVRTKMIAHFNDNNNKIADPALRSVSRIQDNGLDPRPTGADVSTDVANVPNDPFFTQVNYKGAFSSTGPQWINGWSTLDRNDHLAATLTSVSTINNVAAGSVYPNPTNGNATLSFELNAADNITVKILNLAGQVVQTVELGNQTAGFNTTTLETAGLTAGAYFVNIAGQQGTSTIKLIVK